MYYVYFVLAGYRVAIGRTNNLYGRMMHYRRTHRDVFVLGAITCDSIDRAKSVEKDMLKRFKSDNDFRDVFFLSPDMFDFIIKNTIPVSGKEGLERKRESQREHYHNNPEYREQERKRSIKYQQKYSKTPEYQERQRNRKRYQTPEYREYNRQRNKERYRNNPEYREYQRKHRAKKRIERASSPETLTIPGIE